MSEDPLCVFGPQFWPFQVGVVYICTTNKTLWGDNRPRIQDLTAMQLNLKSEVKYRLGKKVNFLSMIMEGKRRRVGKKSTRENMDTEY